MDNSHHAQEENRKEDDAKQGGQEPPEGGKIMSLFDHLGELRTRIVRSLIAVVAFFAVAMFFSTEIIEFLKTPLIGALPEGSDVLHFTGPLDVFLTGIKVSFLTAVVAACPVWIYHFWRFIEPALYEHERKWILPFIFASTALFVAGVAFCYTLIFPMALEFLIGIGTEVATSIITITDYMSLLIILIFAFGLVFQTPLVLVLLAILDLIDADTLANNRRYVFVGILVVGALLTPPDPMSQMGLAVPIYGMFEISIIIIRLIKKKRE